MSKVTRSIKRACNYVTWYRKVKPAVKYVQWHKTLSRGNRKRWLRLPARKKIQLVKWFSQKRGHYTNEVRV